MDSVGNHRAWRKKKLESFKLQLVTVLFGYLSSGAISTDASLVLQGRWWLRLVRLSQAYGGPHMGKAEHSMMIMKLMRVETTWECGLRQTTNNVRLSSRTLQIRYNLYVVNMCLHIHIQGISKWWTHYCFEIRSPCWNTLWFQSLPNYWIKFNLDYVLLVPYIYTEEMLSGELSLILRQFSLSYLLELHFKLNGYLWFFLEK